MPCARANWRMRWCPRAAAPRAGPASRSARSTSWRGCRAWTWACWKIENAVTVYSGRNFPYTSYTGPLVLASLRGIGVAQAETLVDARHKHAARRGAGNGQAFGAVANGPLVAGYGGVVERVYSVAEMPDGNRARLDVTLRLALTGAQARPYKVLDWRTDSGAAP